MAKKRNPAGLEPAEIPLGRAEYERLKEAERILHDLVPLMDAAERCNIDCAEYRQVHQFFTESFAALNREFFTPPPTM